MPRLPLTKNAKLFWELAALGRSLLYLYTFGERYAPKGEKKGSIPHGKARAIRAISPSFYPETFEYSFDTQTLRVADGQFQPIEPEVWDYSVSGLHVLKSWLAYRMKKPAGKGTSPLDKIRPDAWSAQLTRELLELIWVLERTVALEPALNALLEAVLKDEIFLEEELPQPTADEIKAPKTDEDSDIQPDLF